jgi:hypothetical protein
VQNTSADIHDSIASIETPKASFVPGRMTRSKDKSPPPEPMSPEKKQENIFKFKNNLYRKQTLF